MGRDIPLRIGACKGTVLPQEAIQRGPVGNRIAEPQGIVQVGGLLEQSGTPCLRAGDEGDAVLPVE